jgi:nucleoside-diphosphate-sugar epimerase
VHPAGRTTLLNSVVTHPHLSVVAGQLDDDGAIFEAVRTADAVIEGVGSESDATRRIITAMDAAGVKRFVVVSTCSAPDPDDLPDAKFKALARFVKIAAPRAYAEARAAAAAVIAWEGATATVRPPLLLRAPTWT